MKKLLVLIALVAAATLLLRGATPFPTRQAPAQPLVSPHQATITVTIDSGTKRQTVTVAGAVNAYQALVEAARQANLPIETKQYDFGIFVEKIGELSTTDERAWIYFVNAVAGDVAADRKDLEPGDSVEWKYVRPQ